MVGLNNCGTCGFTSNSNPEIESSQGRKSTTDASLEQEKRKTFGTLFDSPHRDNIDSITDIFEESSSSGAVEVDPAVSDGIIGDFEQGDTNHCWILSSIIAVNNTPEGQQLIKDTIQSNNDGTYSVMFAGDPNNRIYTITEDELATNANSIGDKDVAILEEAARQHYAATEADRDDSSKRRDINTGGWAENIPLLTGLTVERFDARTDPAMLKEQLLQANEAESNLEDGSIVMMLETDTWRNANGSLHDVGHNGGSHMLAIVGIDVDADTISYVNPWDSSEVITEDLEQFVKTQSKVKRGKGEHSAGIYSAPGEMKVHPRIQALAESIDEQDAQIILCKNSLELEQDRNGQISDEVLYSVMHNSHDGVEYTSEQRAAAFSLFHSRNASSSLGFDNISSLPVSEFDY